MTWDPKMDKLASMPDFAEVSAKELGRIAPLFSDVSYERGDVLMKEGDTGRQALFIVTGSVEVHIGRRRIAKLGPGEIVGEMALVDGDKRSATVRAAERVTALVVDGLGFHQFFAEPSGWRAVGRAMTRRTRAVQR